VQVGEGSPKLLAGTGKDQVHLLVVANSDRGLCGAFNANIVKAAAKAKAQDCPGQDGEVLPRSAARAAPRSGAIPQRDRRRFRHHHRARSRLCRSREDRQRTAGLYEAGKFDVAHLFFSEFRSALRRSRPRSRSSPCPPRRRPWQRGAVVDYEPDEEAILADLLPRYLRVQIFGALLENMASEQGASMTAMDNATRNAGELIKKLTIQYNRSRQAAITTELVEIIAGAEAL
jgi:F-type H+-transporting ATPase subunit gamma